MEPSGIEKSKAITTVKIIEYVSNSVRIKTIMKKASGNINAVSFDSGEKLQEKASPFDTFIQIIDGKAEIIIDGKSKLLETGQSIIIPAHARNSFIANDRFKMISTVFKSGYEDANGLIFLSKEDLEISHGDSPKGHYITTINTDFRDTHNRVIKREKAVL